MRVNKKYKNVHLLNDVEIPLVRGRIVGITGRNGSGKTTILKILANFTTCERNNKLVSYSYLDDNSEFFNMSYKVFLNFYKNTYHDFNVQKFYELLSILKIDRIDNFKVLSSGERKKIKLAFVLAREVEYYLLDEPFSDIDLFSLSEIVDAIIYAVDLEKSSVYVVDHNIEVLERMVDDCIFIDNGKIYYYEDFDKKRNTDGSLKDLYSKVVSYE